MGGLRCRHVTSTKSPALSGKQRLGWDPGPRGAARGRGGGSRGGVGAGGGDGLRLDSGWGGGHRGAGRAGSGGAGRQVRGCGPRAGSRTPTFRAPRVASARHVARAPRGQRAAKERGCAWEPAAGSGHGAGCGDRVRVRAKLQVSPCRAPRLLGKAAAPPDSAPDTWVRAAGGRCILASCGR